MKIQKTRQVKTPARGTSKSAGLDFYIPEDFPLTIMAKGDTVLIPSGIKVQVPEGHALIAMNKSGVATKLGLQVGACVVDEDYEGEVHIHLTKLNHGTTKLEPGMKIVQFLLMPVNYANVEEVAELESRNTERGTGGFGSTGTH